MALRQVERYYARWDFVNHNGRIVLYPNFTRAYVLYYGSKAYSV